MRVLLAIALCSSMLGQAGATERPAQVRGAQVRGAEYRRLRVALEAMRPAQRATFDQLRASGQGGVVAGLEEDRRTIERALIARVRGGGTLSYTRPGRTGNVHEVTASGTTAYLRTQVLLFETADGPKPIRIALNSAIKTSVVELSIGGDAGQVTVERKKAGRWVPDLSHRFGGRSHP